MSNEITPSARAAVYQKFSEFRVGALIGTKFRVAFRSFKMREELGKQCTDALQELGKLIADWKAVDHLDHALIEISQKVSSENLKTVFSDEPSENDLANLTVMVKLFEACAARDHFKL